MPDETSGAVQPKAAKSGRGNRGWIIGGVVAAILVIAAIAVWVFVNPRVTVPDVVGKTQIAATAEITAAGLVIGTVTPSMDTSLPSGTVTAQSPTPDKRVAKGSAVDLTVAAKPATIAVPDVVGKTKDEAVKAVTDAGLIATAIDELSDKPKGEVFGQVPEAGSEVTTGTHVVVAVSAGPSAQTAKVPAVTGMTQSDAEKAITSAGFVPVVLKEHSSTVAGGKVIAQMPDANASVVKGSEVVITVSLGATPAPPVSVPDVVGKTQTDATTALKNAGLVPSAVSGYSDSVPSGSVVAQNPGSGTSVPKGAEVAIEVSKGKAPATTVNVPDVVGETESAAVSSIQSAGLKAKVVKEYSSSVGAGLVVAQLPEGGAGVAPGAEVGIVVSLGKSTNTVTAVPNVVGKTAADAEKTIKAAGFVPLSVSSITTKTPAGKVAKQLPAAGAKADAGSQVAILVSKAPAATTTKVPDVVGKTSAEAEKLLKDAGFEPVLAEAPDADVPKGTVYAQFPKAGYAAATGAKIAVGVSTGPLEAVQLPGVLPGTPSATESEPATK